MAQKRTGKRRTRAGMARARPAAIQTASPPPPAAATNWKDHPVVIAGVSAAGGIGLSLALFTGIVLPNQTAKLDNEVRELQGATRQQAAVIKTKDAALKKLSKQLSQVSASLAKASSQLYQAHFNRLLSQDSPYPNGAALVHVNMPLRAVADTYGEEVLKGIEPHSRWVDVPLANSPFSSATYYFRKDEKGDLRIIQVLFFLDYKKHFPDDFLEKLLFATYGEPAVTSKNEKHVAWNVNSETNIFFERGESNFLVASKGIVPADWPEE